MRQRTRRAPRDFLAALRAPGVSLIAEVKRASPSAGDLRPDLDPAGQAGIYESNGAAAISVLTDQRFFHGSLEDLHAIRSTVSLPVLRKDFILDPYQVAQARAHEADAILLIVAALDDASLRDLQALAFDMGMAVLVEVHNREELDRALALDPQIVGINNRDLRTFDVSLATTASLRPYVPERDDARRGERHPHPRRRTPAPRHRRRRNARGHSPRYRSRHAGDGAVAGGGGRTEWGMKESGMSDKARG